MSIHHAPKRANQLTKWLINKMRSEDAELVAARQRLDEAEKLATRLRKRVETLRAAYSELQKEL